LGFSGVPYTGPDVGGFTGVPDAELFTRWFQLATFLPFFRGHAAVGTPRREPWSFGEPHTSIHRAFLNLRYRLLPYLYTLAWQSSQHGHPWVRPMFWDFPDESALADVDDQFMLGEALLVAPIFEAGAQVRELILPPGNWYSLWDGEPLSGPGKVSIPAPIEQIPAFVRAGTVLPMEEDKQLTLHVYPPEDPKGLGNTIYSDAGDGYGDWRLDRFALHAEGETLDIRHNAKGAYALPYNKIEFVLHGETFSQVSLNGTPMNAVEGRFSIDKL
jgi:alpha-glucosidase